MASSLIQRISLEGGADFKAALVAIGESGKDAFNALSSSASSASEGAASAGQAFQEIGGHLEDIKGKATEAGKSLQDVSSSFMSTGVKIAAVFAGITAAIALVTSKATEAAKAVNEDADKAKKLGYTPDQLILMNELGAETKNLESAFDDLQKKANEVANGTAKAGNILFDYNIKVKLASGGMREMKDVAADLITAVNKTGGQFKQSTISVIEWKDGLAQASNIQLKLAPAADGIKNVGVQSKIAAELVRGLGKEGAGIADAFTANAAKLKEANDALAERAKLEKEDYENAKALTESQDELEKSSTALSRKIYLAFAEYKTDSNKALTEFINDNKDVAIQLSQLAADALKGLSGAFKGLLSLIPKDAIVEAAKAVGSALKSLFEDVQTLFTKGFDALPATSSLRSIVPFVQAVATVVKDLSVQVFTLFTKGVDALPVESALRLIVTAVTTAKDAFVALGTAVYNAIPKETLIAAASAVGNALKNLSADIKTLSTEGEGALPVESSLRTIIPLAKQAYNFLVEFASGIPAVWKAVRTALMPVVDALELLTGIKTNPEGLLGALFALNFVGLLGAIELAVMTLFYSVSLLAMAGSAFVALASTAGGPWVIALGAIGVALYGLYSNWDAVKQGFMDGIGAIADYMHSKLEAVITWFAAKWEALKAMVGLGGSSGSEGAQGFASGGYVTGPGTSTSDSIRANLSKGEFVIRANAVKSVGVGALHALNSGFKMAVGGYAGPTPSFSGSYAGNTATPPRTSVSLTIGGETFVDMLTPRHVAQKLVSFAGNKQALSMGRKPSWA